MLSSSIQDKYKEFRLPLKLLEQRWFEELIWIF